MLATTVAHASNSPTRRVHFNSTAKYPLSFRKREHMDFKLVVPNISFNTITAASAKDEVMTECARLFSENYGVWGDKADANLGGKRVKMNLDKLKKSIVFNPATCWIVIATDVEKDVIVGHAAYCVFPVDSFSGAALWVTQLVVDMNYRGKRIASALLAIAIQPTRLTCNLKAVGIASSHPHAINALARAAQVNAIDPAFMGKYTALVLEASEIPYLQSPNNDLVGTIFHLPSTTSNLVSIVRTNFNISHVEPQAALDAMKDWTLGNLEDGSEFIVLIELDSIAQSSGRGDSAGSSKSNETSGAV